ncbi:hypothetical protein NGM99_13905 [Mesorhizobium sp. RP14(2022)]|uniref:Uncharacterized protein n=1 Tax=Mesorhizobium liriopis TaxID=2953882 RepID=A0ABT1C7T6_9HYPH|nr:hypothetical protein [Mesorhizobium liriopis]MCO6050874.1 hypothetical protein [Mesorhizobium liriopis]
MLKRRKAAVRHNPRKIDVNLVVQLRCNGASFTQIATKIGCTREGARKVYGRWEREQNVAKAYEALKPIVLDDPRPRLCDELGIRVCEVRTWSVTERGFREHLISLPFVSILDGVPA